MVEEFKSPTSNPGSESFTIIETPVSERDQDRSLHPPDGDDALLSAPADD
jgi:hypothetical protein